ncbi:hypothetical protein [Alkalinema sp. FACHB-956]|uniref:hypothetical protein n=1 Tax=Alkalinema sp. FACHB-956 TaxID=2692768 RepID=UPI0016822A51|nr:hypothetical protein [Alkalinema sp. FACHB-956]MBD2326427.1 hypothetical protein [Alkalinema sp. FACHB-956]
MKMIKITEANDSLADYVANLTEEIVVVTSNGQPIAALVNLENVDLESLSLVTNPNFQSMIERSRARRQQEGGISSEEVRRRLGLAQS